MKTTNRLIKLIGILAWLMPLRLSFTDGDGGGGGGGDGTAPGGGGDAAPAIDNTSHAEEAAKVWNAPAATQASGDPAGDKGGAPQRNDAAPAADADGLLGRLAKKDQQPPGAAPAASQKPDRLTVKLDEIELHGNAAPQTREHFKTVKAYAKQLEADIAELRTKHAGLEETARNASSPELEKLRAEHKALSDRLAIVDLRNHPTFVRQFVEPREKLTGALGAILKDAQVEGVDLNALVALPRAELSKRVSEIAGKLTDFDADEFKAGVRQLMTLEAGSRDALAKAGDTAKALQARTAEGARAAFDETWTSLSSEHGLLQPTKAPDGATAEQIAAIEAYNQGVASIRKEAEQIAFGSSDDKGVARAASEAATFRFLVKHAFPRMQAEHSAMVGLIKDLRGQIESLRGARPDPAAPGSSGGSGDRSQAELDHGAAARQVWRS